MKNYSWTVLSAASGLFIIISFLYTLTNYGSLSSSEGWGIVGMFGLLAIGLLVLFVDYVLQGVITNKRLLNIIEIIGLMIVGLILLNSFTRN